MEVGDQFHAPAALPPEKEPLIPNYFENVAKFKCLGTKVKGKVPVLN
jgi:hypothetical protein